MHFTFWIFELCTYLLWRINLWLVLNFLLGTQTSQIKLGVTLHMPYFKCFLSKYLALNFLLHLSHVRDSITCWPCILILWASYTCFSLVLNLHFLSWQTYLYSPWWYCFLWAFKFFFWVNLLLVQAPSLHM